MKVPEDKRIWLLSYKLANQWMQIALRVCHISSKIELTSFLGMFSFPHFSQDKGYWGQSWKWFCANNIWLMTECFNTCHGISARFWVRWKRGTALGLCKNIFKEWKNSNDRISDCRTKDHHGFNSNSNLIQTICHYFFSLPWNCMYKDAPLISLLINIFDLPNNSNICI